MRSQTGPTADELSVREQALRKLPLPYSLALRLRDAGIAGEVVCEYVGVEEAALGGVYRLAKEELDAAIGLQVVVDSEYG